MKSRVTLACFVHRSVRKVAIAAAQRTFSSAGRVRSQPKRSRAAQQASRVAGLLAHDSMPKRREATTARIAPPRDGSACSPEGLTQIVHRE